MYKNNWLIIIAFFFFYNILASQDDHILNKTCEAKYCILFFT